MHEVNLLAVLVAGIVPMIVGFLWYGQLFGKRWLELMETTAEEIQKNFNPWKTHGPASCWRWSPPSSWPSFSPGWVTPRASLRCPAAAATPWWASTWP